MPETTPQALSTLGQLLILKRQAVCLYNQASNILYPHHVHWSFRLRELGAQSQKHHDILCRFTSGHMVVETFTMFSIIEQPEEKDELALMSLETLYYLEKEITLLEIGDSEEEWANRAQYSQRVSKRNMKWLEWIYSRFSNRFIATGNYTIKCALCGLSYEIKKGQGYIETCPLCDGQNTFG